MWIFLNKEKPKKEKWYICLAVAISDFEIKYYPVIQKWQNGSFTGYCNTIIAWADIPDIPKSKNIYEAIK